MKSLLLGVFIGILVVLTCFVPFQSHAVGIDKYWVGGSGSWFDAANWSPPGPPTLDFDKAYLTQSDAVNRTVYYMNDSDSIAGCSSLVVDATGTGTMMLSISQGILRASLGGLSVGVNGTGTVEQNGGIVLPLLGAIIGPGGTYNLNSGGFGSGMNTALGIQGTFNQSGGGVGIDFLSASDGTYNLSGSGSISGGGLFFGVLNQSGGTVWATGGLGVSTCNLSGGKISPTLNLGDPPNERPTTAFDTLNQSGGTLGHLSGSIAGGSVGISNFNYTGGEVNLTTRNIYLPPHAYTLHIEQTASLSGGGTRTIDANVVNNGVFKVTGTNAVYTGTFTNNGACISETANQYFNDLVIGENGYLAGGSEDQWYVKGDFKNSSVKVSDWNTSRSNLTFVAGMDLKHDFYLTGMDYGPNLSGYSNNFSWATLDIAGNVLYLFDGNETPGGALYARELWGLAISGDQILNMFGQEGLNIYYLADIPQNSYLGGLTYHLQGGGYLVPCCSAPPSGLCMVGGRSFTSIQSAYTAAESGDTIECQDAVFNEDVVVNRDILVTLEGGYDAGFTSNTGRKTTLKGMITATKGEILIKNFILSK